MARRASSDKPGIDTATYIIQSALAVMASDGIAALTTKTVSQKAGVSTASIHYFFETKDNLIHSSFTYMVKLFRAENLKMRKVEKEPITRIVKSINLHFSAANFIDDPSALWPQIWAYSCTDEGVARLFHIFSKRIIDNHMVDLQAIGYSQAEARMKAVELNALTRGIWVETRLAGTAHLDQGKTVLINYIYSMAKDIGYDCSKDSLRRIFD